MELLQAGVERTLIALWLGHESIETTQIYLDANLAMKEEILSKTTPINAKAGRYQPDDDLLCLPEEPLATALGLMPNRLITLVAQLNAKRASFESIRHSPGFGIAPLMPHAA